MDFVLNIWPHSLPQNIQTRGTKNLCSILGTYTYKIRISFYTTVQIVNKVRLPSFEQKIPNVYPTHPIKIRPIYQYLLLTNVVFLPPDNVVQPNHHLQDRLSNQTTIFNSQIINSLYHVWFCYNSLKTIIYNNETNDK